MKRFHILPNHQGELPPQVEKTRTEFSQALEQELESRLQGLLLPYLPIRTFYCTDHVLVQVRLQAAPQQREYFLFILEPDTEGFVDLVETVNKLHLLCLKKLNSEKFS